MFPTLAAPVPVTGESLCWIHISFYTLCGSYLIPSQHIAEGNRFLRPTDVGGCFISLLPDGAFGLCGALLAAQGHADLTSRR